MVETISLLKRIKISTSSKKKYKIINESTSLNLSYDHKKGQKKEQCETWKQDFPIKLQENQMQA
jgi:hypothetical protein